MAPRVGLSLSSSNKVSASEGLGRNWGVKILSGPIFLESHYSVCVQLCKPTCKCLFFYVQKLLFDEGNCCRSNLVAGVLLFKNAGTITKCLKSSFKHYHQVNAFNAYRHNYHDESWEWRKSWMPKNKKFWGRKSWWVISQLGIITSPHLSTPASASPNFYQCIYSIKPVSYTHLTLPTIYSV